MNMNMNVTILNNHNGHRWIQDMTSAFYRFQVKDVVLAGEPKPEAANVGEKDEDFNKRRSDWNRKDDIAKSLIYDSLSDDYKALFQWTLTSSENLKTIKDKVLDNSISAMKLMKAELESISQKSNETIIEYFNRWNSSHSKYRDAGGVLSEPEQLAIFVNKLNSNLDSVVGPIISKEKYDVSFKDLLNELKNYENFLKSRKVELNEQVLFTKEKKIGKTEEVLKEFNMNLVCYNCGGFGHKTLKCSSPRRNGIKLPHWDMIFKKKTQSQDTRDNGFINVKDANHCVREREGQQLVEFTMEEDEYPYPCDPPEKGNNITTYDCYYGSFNQNEFDAFNLNEFESFNLNEDNLNLGQLDSFNLNEEKDYTILDSGSTISIFKNFEYFDLNLFKSYSKPQSLGTYKKDSDQGEGDTLGEGPVSLRIIRSDQSYFALNLKRAIYCPSSRLNIISEGYLQQVGGIEFKSTQNGKDAYLNGNYIFSAKLQSNLLYTIDMDTGGLDQILYTYRSGLKDPELIHQRFGHQSNARICKSVDSVIGLNMLTPRRDHCEICSVTKSKYKTHLKPYKRQPYEPLGMVVMDYKGPFSQQSKEGFTGYIVFIDVYSHFGQVFGLKKKDESLSKFIEFQLWIETQTNSKIKCVRSDQAKEIIYGTFADHLKKIGIRQQYTSADSQSSNGTAEARIRVINQMARSMIQHSSVSPGFWFRAVHTANYLYNRTLNANNQTKTPFELIFNRQPRVDYFRVFGCICYFYIHKQYRKTFDKNAKVGRFLGYSDNSNSYVIFSQNKFILSRHVDFNENIFDYKELKDEVVETSKHVQKESKRQVTFDIPADQMIGRQDFSILQYGMAHNRESNQTNNDNVRALNQFDENNGQSYNQENNQANDDNVESDNPDNQATNDNVGSNRRVHSRISETQSLNSRLPLPVTSFNRGLTLRGRGGRGRVSNRIQGRTEEQRSVLQDDVSGSRMPRLRLILPPRSPESSEPVQSSELSQSSESLEELTRINTLNNRSLSSELNGNFWQQLPIDVDAPRRTRSSNTQDTVNALNINYIDEEINILESINYLDDVPNNYKQARKHSESKGWMEALQREYRQLDNLNAFNLIPRRDVTDQKINTTTITFTRKPAPLLYKARLCFRGDLEKNNLQLEDTFASVIRTENLRLVLCMILSLKWKFVFIDISNAFINAKMPRLVYLEIPVDHPDAGKRPTHVFKLNRALYGTTDAPKLWNDELWATLKEMGYLRTKSDWNLFYKDKSFIVFHVDDGILSASDDHALNEIIAKLRQKYKMTVQESNIKYLKLNIKITQNCIYIDQSEYIEEMTRKFEVSLEKKYDTPMITNFVSQESNNDQILDESTPYRGIIGSLLFIARQTRPDITFAVNYLSQYVTKPTKSHWNAAKRVLIYLYNTRFDSLRIGPVNNEGIKCYSDATWADCTETRRSRSGGVLFYNGTLISAHSHTQRSVSLSSTQAEYQALTSAIQEIIYYRQLLGELGYANNLPTPLMCDNQGALYLAVSTKNHTRIKHIELRYHYIRETVQEKKVQLIYINTKDQIADIMTKPLAKDQFIKFKELMGIKNWQDESKI